MKDQLHGYHAAQKASPRWREEMVLAHYALVKRVALRIAARLPRSVDADDLISVGVLGLYDAIEKYDPAKKVPFALYAELRVRGAILDELRNHDFLSRGGRRLANELEETRARLREETGREPSSEDLATALGISLEELHEATHETKRLVFLDLESCLHLSHEQTAGGGATGSGSPLDHDPYRLAEDKAARDLIVEALGKLPEKLMTVLSLYYQDDLNFKEIGKVLDVSESRVSQLHKEAIERLQKYLKARGATG